MTDKPSSLERRDAAIQAAALEQYHAQQDEFARVSTIVLGEPNRRRPNQHIDTFIKVGDGDYVVSVAEYRSDDPPKWTTVVGNQRSSWYWRTHDEALLHLVARRHDDNPNSNSASAICAGRVLLLPADTTN